MNKLKVNKSRKTLDVSSIKSSSSVDDIVCILKKLILKSMLDERYI